MYTISQLFIYPVKSLGGIALSSSPLTMRGLQYDRRWMLVDANGLFLTQRAYPQMCLLQSAIQNNQLVIYHKHDYEDYIAVPLLPLTHETVKVNVWGKDCEAWDVGLTANQWLSDKLSMPCRLVYMPDSTKRKVDPNYAHNGELTSFADDYPLLMIGQASLDDLNSRLINPLPMDRFRPNIVFEGGQPYDEDMMAQVAIHDIEMYGVKLCARCVITTIDQRYAFKGIEPLKTLAGYRMKNNKIYFGQNMLLNKTGHLTVGDTIRLINRHLPFELHVNKDQARQTI